MYEDYCQIVILAVYLRIKLPLVNSHACSMIYNLWSLFLQAFEIARSLGIACTLTPNMMVTATVPDKLGVTSFVYQMYQYFNKATQSAITRQNSRNVGSGTNSPTGQELFSTLISLASLA